LERTGELGSNLGPLLCSVGLDETNYFLVFLGRPRTFDRDRLATTMGSSNLVEALHTLDVFSAISVAPCNLGPINVCICLLVAHSCLRMTVFAGLQEWSDNTLESLVLCGGET
jgi:hypothetical protein